MMSTGRLLIVGAGGFGREVICWLSDAVDRGLHSGALAFIDDQPAALDAFGYGLPWAGSVADFAPAAGDRCVLALTDPPTKERVVASLLARGAEFITLVHPTAVIARSATIGRGCVICPMAMVSADATVGEFVTINGLSSVGHDVRLGAYSTLSAHVDITGGVTVGTHAFFGTGAKTVPRIKIGTGAKVGAGATVMRSVPDGVTVFTMPAKKL